MLVQTREPSATVRLQRGDRAAVPPGRPHRVVGENDGPCRFVIVQGVGTYDYLPED